MIQPRIKICCIASLADAQLAIAAGASALGLVSAMPSGPGVIEDALIAAISASIPPGVASFLLTCAQDVDQIIAQQRRLRPSALQLCDRLSTGAHAKLRSALPGIGIVQVIHVADDSAVKEAISIAPEVDAILLDSGKQNLMVKELGGTGRRHDWAISRRIRAAVNCPVYLAGGLNSSNVAEAIETVRPFGVDVCTGVRSSGKLDPVKLTAFMRAAESLNLHNSAQ